MEQVQIYSLIKIGKKKHILDLYEHGIIYMNDIHYFRHIEDQELRGDKHEGLKGLEQATQIKILVKGKEIAAASSGQLKFRDRENRGNIYCLLAITSLENFSNFRIDERNEKFGGHFLIIWDVVNFMERIIKKIKHSGLEYKYNLVKYYNLKEYAGPLDVFCKPKNFEYQREFRIYVKRKESNSLKLEIGSLKNISKVFEINKLSKIEYKFEHST